MNMILAQATNNSAGGGLIGFGFIFLLIGLLYTVAWVYALISAATRSDLDTTSRLLWLALLIFVPGIGTLLYFLIGRARR